MKKKKDDTIWQELLQAAKTIEHWTTKQRKAYLSDLLHREKTEGKTIFRNMIKIMLTDTERRKHFIKFVKAKKYE